MNRRGLARRTLLTATGAALGALSGCVGNLSTDGSDDGNGADGGPDEVNGETDGGDGGSDPDDGTGTDATATDLDLREANVTEVTVESTGDGEYDLSVTLYHDDDGEDGYADRWVVERRDGSELGRRELLHAHSTAPFTRSTTVSIPDGVDCVVVRGHDQTHGYGGQAALVDLDGGATDLVRQGREPSSFADRSCPE